MFDTEGFVQGCRAATAEPSPQEAVAGLVREAVAEAGWIEEAVAPLGNGGPRFLCRQPHLTVYCLVMSAGFRLPPHDHQLWAVAGIASGGETNELYRRDADGRLVLDRVIVATAGDVVSLDPDAVHASWTEAPTATVHVYGGDILATPRSTWASPTSDPRPARRIPHGTARDAEAYLASLRAEAPRRPEEHARG